MRVIDDTLEDDEGKLVGGYEAYVVNKDEGNWKFFLKREIDNEKVSNLIIYEIEKSIINNVSILRNLSVNDEDRGCGYGNSLMDKYLDVSSDCGADLFILVADKGESQSEGFVLQSWYEKYDFEAVYDMPDVTLMIYDSTETLKLKEKIADLIKPAKKNKM